MASQNRIIRSIAPKAIFEEAHSVISSASTWDQGDLLYFDTSAKVIKRLASEGNAATFLGIARTKIVSGVPASPYQGLASQPNEATGAVPGPQFGLIAALVLKSGDALSPGALVYADPATGNFNVQASGTKDIGVYQGASVTGDGVTSVEVFLGARYPDDTLRF
jgi:hypothetical protein